MKIPGYIKLKFNKIANMNLKSRQLSKQVIIWCEENNINTYGEEFLNSFAYLKSSCSADEILDYIENLPKRLGMKNERKD